MGRLGKSRVKTTAEKSSPPTTIKKSKPGKVNSKGVKKNETNLVDRNEAGPSDKLVEINDKKDCKLTYSSQKKPVTRKSVKEMEDRLHLYDFEVDENEPVVKKGKRKPILKIKKHRTYKNRFKFLPTPLRTLEDAGKENGGSNGKRQVFSKERSVPLAEISNIHFKDNLDLSIDAAVPSKRLTLYSPKPYRSPKRDSLIVPVLRTSDSNASNLNTSSRSLNTSTNSNYHDKTNDISTYSGSFMNQLFMGSSTPIRSHWTEDPEHSLSQRVVNVENFNLSNNFGFDDNSIDEPFVSPIKINEAPSNSLAPQSPAKLSPIKVPFKRVMKMLKFGCDALESDGEISFEGLPSNFFHEGDTPSFSPASTPSASPVRQMKAPHSERIKKSRKKKQLTFQEDLDDSGNITQSSEDKENNENNEKTYKNKRRNLKSSKEEKDKGYETEDQRIVPPKKQVRRSYERPAYLRSKKKVGTFGFEDDEDDHEETVSAKPDKKKHGGLSKKEEMEMEKWAKAFNEQCMQVENFNLCVE